MYPPLKILYANKIIFKKRFVPKSSVFICKNIFQISEKTQVSFLHITSVLVSFFIAVAKYMLKQPKPVGGRG
jgi:hypothetical protein